MTNLRGTHRRSLQAEYEWNFINQKRQGFDVQKCRAWAKLTERFGPRISQEELLSLALVVSNELGMDLSREYKRRKELLIKWFDERLDRVWGFVENRLVISDRQGHVIAKLEKRCEQENMCGQK